MFSKHFSAIDNFVSTWHLDSLYGKYSM